MRNFWLGVVCLGLLGAAVTDWRRDPGDELANHLFRHEVPATQYCVVNSTHTQTAIKRLWNYPIVDLSDTEVRNYASPCNVDSKQFYYLVRALDVSGNNSFTVYEYEGSVYVTSGVLGTSALPRRTALVLSTQSPVSHIYVSYFVAK